MTSARAVRPLQIHLARNSGFGVICRPRPNWALRGGQAVDRNCVVVLALVCFTGAAFSQNKPQEARLTAALQDLLVSSLPSPLYENSKNWGMKHKNLRGQMKNEGRWWKV